MLLEKDFEEIICKYPELIEESLVLKGRQLTLYGRRMDVLFEDKFGRELIIELKVGPIKDEHIGQLLSYEGMRLSGENPDVRVMLIGNRVPPNIQRSLDHHGIAWKEITIIQLKEFLTNRKDSEILSLLQTEKELIHAKEEIGSVSYSSQIDASISHSTHSFKEENKLSVIPNSKKGLLFHCSKEENNNISKAIEHLSNHDELYWSVNNKIRKDCFSHPFTGLINSDKKIVAKCTIKGIKKYEESDHRDPSKKPISWIESQKIDHKEYQVTLVITEMRDLRSEIYETGELIALDKDGMKKIGKPTQTPRVILLPSFVIE